MDVGLALIHLDLDEKKSILEVRRAKALKAYHIIWSWTRDNIEKVQNINFLTISWIKGFLDYLYIYKAFAKAFCM